MAFELPITEMAFALGSLNLKFPLKQSTFSLELLLWKSIFEFEFSLLMATLGHRKYRRYSRHKNAEVYIQTTRGLMGKKRTDPKQK